MTAAVREPPRRRKREETRGRLMDAAIGIFARSGFDRATVDEIVREAGFSKGAFYVHFESKEDLFWAMLEERISRQQDTFRRAVGHTQPVAEKVPQRLAAMYDRWRELIADILSEGREAGRIRSDIDVQFIATVLIAATEGSIMQSRLAPETVRLDEMLEPLTTILAEWLQPPAHAGL